MELGEMNSLFKSLNITVNNNADLQKCKDICKKYDIKDEDFKNLWEEFCARNSIDLNPTLENLQKFENEISENSANCTSDKEKEIMLMLVDDSSSSLEIISEPVINSEARAVSTTRKRKRHESPQEKLRNNDNLIIKPAKSTFSRIARPSKKIASGNTNRVKVVAKFGKKIYASKKEDDVIEIPEISIWKVPKYAEYSREKLSFSSIYTFDLEKEIGVRLMNNWSKVKNVKLCYMLNENPAAKKLSRVVGRINCDPEANAVYLNAFDPFLLGLNDEIVSFDLDLTGVSEFSFYSGQIVAVEGFVTMATTRCKIFKVTEIFTKSYVRRPPSPEIIDKLHIIVAAGPFTAYNNLDFQPLWDLMRQVSKEKPDVLILIGPFIDFDQATAMSSKFDCTFKEFFEKLVEQIVDKIQGKPVQVVVVPSGREPHHELFYPTIEYTLPDNLRLPNMHLVSDPCLLYIEGLTIGATSVDSLTDMSSVYISNSCKNNRLERLANHMVSQCSFYPIFPPKEGVCLETWLWVRYGFYDMQPHIKIIPSNLMHFCKVINGTFFLNPGRMRKGTYARMLIKSHSDDTWFAARDMYCEIVKLS